MMKLIVGSVAALLLIVVTVYSVWPDPQPVPETRKPEESKKEEVRGNTDTPDVGDQTNKTGFENPEPERKVAPKAPAPKQTTYGPRKSVTQHVCENGESCFGGDLIDDSILGAVPMQRSIQPGQTCPKCGGQMFVEVWTLPDN